MKGADAKAFKAIDKTLKKTCQALKAAKKAGEDFPAAEAFETA